MSAAEQKSAYEVLGVPPDASQDSIKLAYRKLSAKWHPDKKGGDKEKFQEITADYEQIGTPEARAVYDTYGPQAMGEAQPLSEDARIERIAVDLLMAVPLDANPVHWLERIIKEVSRAQGKEQDGLAEKRLKLRTLEKTIRGLQVGIAQKDPTSSRMDVFQIALEQRLKSAHNQIEAAETMIVDMGKVKDLLSTYCVTSKGFEIAEQVEAEKAAEPAAPQPTEDALMQLVKRFGFTL